MQGGQGGRSKKASRQGKATSKAGGRAVRQTVIALMPRQAGTQRKLEVTLEQAGTQGRHAGQA